MPRRRLPLVPPAGASAVDDAPAGGAVLPGRDATDLPHPRIAKLGRQTFRAHIADRLRAAILAGELAPGAALIETTLARQFDVSRGPLREALRQLIEEGLLVAVPYTGTRVVELSAVDVDEIHSLRIALERFAFEQVWPRRDEAFALEMRRRHRALLASIDAGDDPACIEAELSLHGLVYEACGHRLLQRHWAALRGRLQLYWAAHHRAHRSPGPRRDAHDSYLRCALGDDLDAMRAEIDAHMRRGLAETGTFLREKATIPRGSRRLPRGASPRPPSNRGAST